MTRPRLTIGVPVFNGARHLEQCLDSLLAQTYDHLEIVISDNASTDRTPEICRSFCERDPRVTYHRQPQNIGAAANYNFLVRHTEGELFKWAAHDDVCAPDFVERCVAALDHRPDAVLAFPKMTFIDDAGEVLSKYDADVRWRDHHRASGRLDDLLADPQATLLHKCHAQFGVIRRSAVRRTRLIGNYGSSDLVLLVELALLGGFVDLDEYLFFSRVHDGSSLRANATAADLARWYDPARGGTYPMPQTRVFVGYLGAVAGSALPLHERIGAVSPLTRWLASNRRWRVIGGELRLRATERLSVLRCGASG